MDLVLGLCRFDQLAKDLVRLCADHHVATREVGWHPCNAGRASEFELLVDARSIAVLSQRSTQVATVEADGIGQSGEDVG